MIRKFIEKIRACLIALFGPIFIGTTREDYLPGSSAKPMIFVFLKEFMLTWWLRGFLLLVGSYLLSWVLKNDYFLEGAQENLSGLWWNLITVVGIIWICIANIFKQINLHSVADKMFKSARGLLNSASEIGAFSCGLLTGMFFLIVATESLQNLKAYIALTFGLYLLLVVFALNILVWFIAYCSREDVETPHIIVRFNGHRLISVSVCAAIILIFSVVTAKSKPNAKQRECVSKSEYTG